MTPDLAAELASLLMVEADRMIAPLPCDKPFPEWEPRDEEIDEAERLNLIAWALFSRATGGDN